MVTDNPSPSEPWCDYRVFEAIIRDIALETERSSDNYVMAGKINWPSFFADVLLAMRMKDDRINKLEDRKGPYTNG